VGERDRQWTAGRTWWSPAASGIDRAIIRSGAAIAATMATGAIIRSGAAIAATMATESGEENAEGDKATATSGVGITAVFSGVNSKVLPFNPSDDATVSP